MNSPKRPMPKELAPVVDEVAGRLGVAPATLKAYIWNESGWYANAKNTLSSACGLAQLTNAACKSIGVVDAKGRGSSAAMLAQFPDERSQLLGPVLRFFMQGKPYRNAADFAIFALSPKYRKTPHRALPAAQQKANKVQTYAEYGAKITNLTTEMG